MRAIEVVESFVLLNLVTLIGVNFRYGFVWAHNQFVDVAEFFCVVGLEVGLSAEVASIVSRAVCESFSELFFVLCSVEKCVIALKRL